MIRTDLRPFCYNPNVKLCEKRVILANDVLFQAKFWVSTIAIIDI